MNEQLVYLEQRNNKELRKMKKLIIISILTSSLLYAVSVQEINNQAVKLLEKKEPEKAFTILEKEYINKNYDNQMLFLLGTTSKQIGNFEKSIKYFEELIERDPKALRVKLDLAAAYYQVGNLDKAKELLLQVKATQPPQKVGDNIDSFLAVIDKGIPKLWSVNFGIGYQYDSNVNAGPDTNTVLMYGLPFTLNEDAKGNSDTALKYNFGFNHLQKIDGFAIQSSISASVTDYKDLNSLDTQLLSISTGPTFRNGKFVYSIPLIANVQKVGHEDRYYSISKGISPQVSYQLENNMSLNANIGLQNKRYYKNPKKESNSITFSPSFRYFLDQSSYLNIGGYLGKENSKIETSSNNSKGLNLGYFKAFTQKMNMYASASYSRTDYKGIESAYNESREDTHKNIGLNLSYVFSQYDINASLNMSYSRNSSNIEIYDYDREIIGVTFSKSF